MLRIDLQNAFEPGRDADNFTVLLLKLIAKSDSINREKLSYGFPVEVEAVDMFHNDCPYKDEAHNEVDWEEIEKRAFKRCGM